MMNLGREYSEARDKLRNLYGELNDMCGVSTILAPGGRQRRREVIEQIQCIENMCIQVLKPIVTEALENKRIYELNKVMWDRLEILNQGMIQLSQKNKKLCWYGQRFVKIGKKKL